MAKKTKNSARGNRYTPQEKAKILAYVDTVNAKTGRGGAAAASRKFNISQITIGQWIKKMGKNAPSGAGRQAATSPADFSKKLKRLAELHEAIATKEAELDDLKAEYESLKRSL